MTDLGTLYGGGNDACGTNALGQVLGESDGYAVMSQNGGISRLYRGRAWGVSDSGYVSGSVDSAVV